MGCFPDDTANELGLMCSRQYHAGSFYLKDPAKSGLIEREKARYLWQQALDVGWLDSGAILPDDAAPAEQFIAAKRAAAGSASSLEAHRDRSAGWLEDGINGRVIHRMLCESHWYRGS